MKNILKNSVNFSRCSITANVSSFRLLPVNLHIISYAVNVPVVSVGEELGVLSQGTNVN